MKIFQKTSIKRTLMRISLMTTGVALVLTSVALITDEMIAFRRSLVENLTSQAKIIGSNSTAALLFNDAEAAGENLWSLRASKNITCAAMYARDGSIFAAYRRDSAQKDFIPPSVQDEGYDFGINHLALFQRIFLADEQIGTIYIRSDLKQLYSRLFRYAAVVIVVIATSLFLAFLLLSKLQLAITKPVQDLAHLMRDVSIQKNYAVRSSVQSDNELGSLARGFNEMLSQIQTRDSELERHREHLEAEVAKRTEQLQKELAERRRAEEELKTFAAKLEQSNKELQDLTFIASHDLREPLRKVTAFGDRLKSALAEKLDTQSRDYLERMQRATQRMHVLIDGLLIFSRVTTKAQPFAPVDLNTVAQEVLSDLKVRIEQENGRVELGELPVIDADPLQMRQLFQNLIGNALKFHKKEEPPVVKVQSQIINPPLSPFSKGGRSGYPIFDSTNSSFEKEDPSAVPPFEKGGQGGFSNESSTGNTFCRITVEDNGIGFDEKYLDRIFGVFQRLHGRSEYEGTGMGLAICKKIVERHGGGITAKSAPGQGATFIVSLPVKQNSGGADG